MKKKYAKNNIPGANEKVLVLYFDEGILKLELITIEALWAYVTRGYRYHEDPYDLLGIPQNMYSIGRAEQFGMAKEREAKYGR